MKSIITACALAAFLTVCKDTAIPPEKLVDPGWERTVSTLLQEGDCRGARAALSKVETREPLWYELMSRSYIVCRKEGGSFEDADKAIAVIDAGLKRFPNSSNLLLSRGYRHQDLGRVEDALADFRAAETRARSNVNAGSASTNQSEAAIAVAAARAARALETSTAGQLRTEQQILTALAEGKCDEAVGRLEKQVVSTRTASWFHLSFVVGSYCENTSEQYRAMAQAAVHEGRKRHPESGLLLIDAALWSERNGNSREALELYEQALRHPEVESYYQGGADAIKNKIAALRHDASRRR